MALAKNFIRLFVRWWAMLSMLAAAYYAYLALGIGPAFDATGDITDEAIELLFGVGMGVAVSSIPAVFITTIHTLVRFRGTT